MSQRPKCSFFVATPRAPGAIAIIQLHGEAAPVLHALTDITDWPLGRARLARLGDIDEGLVVRLDDDVADHAPWRCSRRAAPCEAACGIRCDSRSGREPRSARAVSRGSRSIRGLCAHRAGPGTEPAG